MADPTASSDTNAVDDPQSPPAAPRWAKVFAVIAVVAIVMVAVMLLAGGDHGPGRHTSADPGSPAPTSGVTLSSFADGHAPPAGGHTP
ncbi:MAG: hypothetical protein H0W96_03420 [Solirubrobacterales bacterium]|nr:hypothetical protein [Solirubrobacterales bacterium]